MEEPEDDRHIQHDEEPDDEVDGCDVDFTEKITHDDEIAALLQKPEEREEEDAVRHWDGPEAA
jgi:hypothetical protein